MEANRLALMQLDTRLHYAIYPPWPYRYDALIVSGAGGRDWVSDIELAAKGTRDSDSGVLIVSGGSATSAEPVAFAMRRYAMAHGFDGVFVEPCAQTPATSIRNGARLMFRLGMTKARLVGRLPNGVESAGYGLFHGESSNAWTYWPSSDVFRRGDDPRDP